MDGISLLIVVAFLLIAADMAGRDRHPLVMLAGLVLLGLGILSRLFGDGASFGTFTTLFTEVGVSLFVTALWLKVRKSRANPQPFFVLSLMALGVAGLLYLGGSFFGGGRLFGQPLATDQASFLLELGPDDRIEEVAPILHAYDVRYERAFPTIDLTTDEDLAQVYLVHGDPATFDALMDALAADAENVDYVLLNRTVSLPPLENTPTETRIVRSYLENDPLVASQWGLEAIHGHEAHALLQGLMPARKARVAIVDTGVDATHEDVQHVFHRSPGATDGNGHGTHCAGIAGAATNNGRGIASLNWEGRFIEVAGYPALGAHGTGTLESIAQAIIDAAKDGADVISMSLGDVSPVPPPVLVDAVEFAHRRGAIVVASAGNSNEDAIDHFPSNIDGVIAVAAVDQQLHKAKFSNTVGRLSRPLAAPGVDILSTMPGSEYKNLSGTSMATPMVSGLLGILRALHPDLTAEQAYAILHETGTTIEATPQVGRLIHAEAAIQAVRASL